MISALCPAYHRIRCAGRSQDHTCLGQYEDSMTIKVYVPSGCTAYYEFNGTPTTDSTEYTGPVSMPVGEIFSAIIVDENGKIQSGSATYVIYQ